MGGGTQKWFNERMKYFTKLSTTVLELRRTFSRNNLQEKQANVHCVWLQNRDDQVVHDLHHGYLMHRPTRIYCLDLKGTAQQSVRRPLRTLRQQHEGAPAVPSDTEYEYEQQTTRDQHRKPTHCKYHSASHLAIKQCTHLVSGFTHTIQDNTMISASSWIK